MITRSVSKVYSGGCQWAQKVKLPEFSAWRYLGGDRSPVTSQFFSGPVKKTHKDPQGFVGPPQGHTRPVGSQEGHVGTCGSS